jgi:hypothetical protein
MAVGWQLSSRFLGWGFPRYFLLVIALLVLGGLIWIIVNQLIFRVRTKGSIARMLLALDQEEQEDFFNRLGITGEEDKKGLLEASRLLTSASTKRAIGHLDGTQDLTEPSHELLSAVRDGNVKIRKQIDDLTLGDLQEFPIWEYCLDEECEEGQDECTVRPFRIGECNLESMFICSVTFTLANGKQYLGFVSPEDDLGYSLPTLYIDNEKLIHFWHGPKPPIEEIDKYLEWLGGRHSNIFPIIWRTPFLSESLPQQGIIDGMYYLEERMPVKIA